MMYDWNGMDFWGGSGMLLGTLVVLGLLALIFWGRGNRPAPEGGADRPERLPPLEILRRRYAAGEISAAEFTQAQQVLGAAPPPPV